MLIKSGGNLTIRTFGGLGLGGDFDNDTWRHKSTDSWVPYDEYIAIECIIAPNQLYQLLTDVAQVATVAAQLNFVGYQYLQGGLRLVREDGSCIDFSGKAMLDNLFSKSKDILDLDFLHVSEGYRGEAYWPKGSSGITIGYGVDIGQQNEDGLIKWGVPQSIIDKIKDYLGVTGEAADTLLKGLKDKTLGLSDSEIKQLSDIVQKQTTENIINKYNAATKGVSFDRIPYNTRTAIIDLFYQYNINTASVKEPRTWGFIINNDWNGFYNELMNFGDGFAPRRKREADLVLSDINRNQYIYR
ncbi:TPA: pesticin C-terminus-like muramidase [Salmonella enterica subsp. diarizonae serovar 61:i:z]